MLIVFYLGPLMKEDGTIDEELNAFHVISNDYIDNIDVDGLAVNDCDDGGILYSIFQSPTTNHSIVIGTKEKVEDTVLNQPYTIDEIKKAYFLSESQIVGSRITDDFIYLKANDGTKIDICKRPNEPYKFIEFYLKYFGVPTWL